MIHHANLLVATLSFLACAVDARAADIHVPVDQPTIQQGIDVAMPGDRVLVAPGTYVEHIDFHGKNVQVIGIGGAAVTTIDGSHTGSVATFASGESRDAMLTGFAMVNGQGDRGGGVHIENASPSIENNDIRENQSFYGGGIYIGPASDPRIYHNRIRANIGLIWGGGIYVNSTATIQDNTVERNTEEGIDVFDAGLVALGRNIIRGNDGPGILLTSSQVFIFDNLIVRNMSAGIMDVGIYGTVVVVNNTVADNSGVADVDIGWPTAARR